jgi:hypothetical protein
MKKVFSTVFILILCFTITPSTFAQLQKGNFMVGGGLNYGISNTESFDLIGTESELKSTVFLLKPKLGYLITDNLVIGFEGSYSEFWQRVNVQPPSESTSITDIKSIGGGAFMRKFFPVQDKFAFFGQFSSSYLSRNQENSLNQNNSTLDFENISRIWDNRISAGISFFPTHWIAIELQVIPVSFGIERTEANGSGTPAWRTKTSSSFFNFDLNTSSIFIGANIFINRKK